ncbi:MAG: 23S rRNA (guanosine(2251)-2'-O)-methyltransferase RlmB [Symbiobacteriaceae bacterium]|nr:23S rRNA (guanosine(2251)-2'-O)-methyltransferase RlmB [Symbiobacteriaceae bacterium]
MPRSKRREPSRDRQEASISEDLPAIPDIEQIEGRHPVYQALQGERLIHALHLLKGGSGSSFAAIVRLAEAKGVPITWQERPQLDRLSQQRPHQGAIAIALAKPLKDPADLLALAQKRGELPFLLVLDGLEDPQNVGALIRSAAAAGCHGLIMRQRRAAGVTPALIKASAGAWEELDVAQVVNIARTLEELKKAGVWVVGAHAGEKTVYHQDFSAMPLALVIGSEGAGLSHLVRQSCDFLVSLPMQSAVNSLNAASAGAALLFEIVRQRMPKPEIIY